MEGLCEARKKKNICGITVQISLDFVVFFIESFIDRDEKIFKLI